MNVKLKHIQDCKNVLRWWVTVIDVVLLFRISKLFALCLFALCYV
jgi:hypothetical protein